ncbi:MAG: 3'-5' exonuclease, partial [Litoreibacter sp.]|nr:3'-5' exonuclease [Litoreibacter sp.]
LAGLALWLGWSRGDIALPTTPFMTAFVAFALLNTGLILGIWLLFDENVAKPINRLSVDLRMWVHSDVTANLQTEAARYLGDLAPAAAALSAKADQGLEHSAANITRETKRLEAEQARLTALLTESPIGTILINPAQEIVLYDAQAASLLSAVAPPRLKAPLCDYFDPASFDKALAASGGSETECNLRLVNATAPIPARVKTLNDDGHMLFFDPKDPAKEMSGARPLVFDFALMRAVNSDALKDQPLSEMCFVVLDLETTGLSIEKDAIVQIGAVRVLRGEIVPGEEFATNVDPGRPIPPASTRIHHISDDDVAGAPDISEAGQHLHHFARDAVLVAHNAPFDIGFLKQQEDSIGASWDHPVLDTVLLSAVAFGVTEEHSLDALCDRLEITIAPEDRHTALGDARVTAKALVHLLKMLSGQGFETIGDLQPDLDRAARRLYAAR